MATYTGYIGANGEIISSIGNFKAHHERTGLYTITFGQAFTHIPVIVVTPVNQVGFLDVWQPSEEGFSVGLQNSAGTQMDYAFMFIAIGN